MSLLQRCATQALRGLFGIFVCMVIYGSMIGLWGVVLIAAIMAGLIYYADCRFLQQDAAQILQQNSAAKPHAAAQNADSVGQQQQASN